jgi:hypothetical protein
MPWNQSQRSDADPMITTSAWRILRRQWKARGLPCARCGRQIDYAGGRFLPSGKINRASFVLGHKTSRREARALGWSEAMINDSSNLQAEHLGCSNSSGAVLGRAIQGGPGSGTKGFGTPATNGSTARAPVLVAPPRGVELSGLRPYKGTHGRKAADQRW